MIVGAGAAGLATAIFTRRRSRARRVLLLDGAARPGAKILMSGGSRCNVTNAIVTDEDFWGGPRSIVRRVLRAFPPAKTVAFFREIGVALHEEADGKLFPDTNRARDVLAALLRELDAVGATLAAGERVLDVTRERDGFAVVTATRTLRAPRVVLATGGRSVPKSGSDGAGLAIAARLGHTIVPTTPALAPLVLPDEERLHGELAGVAHDVELTIWIDGRVSTRLAGALLWTHVGVSGPVALNASRHWLRALVDGRQPAITMNVCGGGTFDDVDARLVALGRERPKASMQTILATFLPASLAGALVKSLALDPAVTLAHLPRDDRRRLARALTEWPLPISGSRGYNFAEATAGGVSLAEVDPATMESRVCRGLFLVGEMLDVDGRIGGFNFQWAWSSAFVAARALGAERT